MRKSTRRQRLAVLGTAVAVAAVPFGAFASPAQAEGPAVIDKTLTIFSFGAGFAIPTGCLLINGVAGDIAGQNGLSSTVSPVLDQVEAACTQIADAGVDMIAQGKAAAAPLAFINQFANPAIQQFADTLTQTGNDNAELIAPFGATVAGLGATVNFFQGS